MGLTTHLFVSPVNDNVYDLTIGQEEKKQQLPKGLNLDFVIYIADIESMRDRGQGFRPLGVLLGLWLCPLHVAG